MQIRDRYAFALTGRPTDAARARTLRSTHATSRWTDIARSDPSRTCVHDADVRWDSVSGLASSLLESGVEVRPMEV